MLPFYPHLARFFPVLSFFAGFAWDALTLGRRVGVADFWQLGAYLVGAGGLAWWLAWRDAHGALPPPAEPGVAGRWRALRWQAPYLLIQFFFGGVYSALFIFYAKSSGHLASALLALLLGGLLVANEFWRDRYGRRFSLTWALFALCAALLLNFVLPHAAGSVSPLWFYASTLLAVLVAHGLRHAAPGRPGRIGPAWGVGAALLAAWQFGMIAPVPLVLRDLAIGQGFARVDGQFRLEVEPASPWCPWCRFDATVHVPEGQRLYGVSAVFAPLGVTALLEHRWEFRAAGGWRVMARSRFAASGGRGGGFRGYSWVLDPPSGDWRLVVATQDGRTIAIEPFTVVRGAPEGREARIF